MAALILSVITDGDLREGIRELLELEGYAILDTDMAVLGVQLAQEYVPNLVLLVLQRTVCQSTHGQHPLCSADHISLTADELLVTVDACLQ